MGLFEGKVALITGAARGQGRSHAVRLASEGADIIAVDLCDQIPTVEYSMANTEDLEETVRLVESTGRRIVAQLADVRDGVRLRHVVEAGVANFGGRLDVVSANAGILALTLHEPTDPRSRRAVWQDTIDVNLTGAWNTIEAAAPSMIAAGNGGTIVLTSSAAGLEALANDGVALTAYAASKHGLVALVRNFAVDLAKHNIRVNSVHPSGVHTPMVDNVVFEKYMADNQHFASVLSNALPIDALDPTDVTNAIVYLASDSGRYITGIQLPLDAGELL